MMARAYRRYASLAPVEETRAAGGAPLALRSDEVSRHAVRLVDVANTVAQTRDQTTLLRVING